MTDREARWSGLGGYDATIEVYDGAGAAASLWQEGRGDHVIEAALDHDVIDWAWSRTAFGVVLELTFLDEAAWDAFRADPAVIAALDAVPDPVGGLLVYKGRGGGSGRKAPRKPRPLIGSGAAALPIPTDLWADMLAESFETARPRVLSAV